MIGNKIILLYPVSDTGSCEPLVSVIDNFIKEL